MKSTKYEAQMQKAMEEEYTDSIYRSVCGIVKERAEAAGRDLEVTSHRNAVHTVTSRLKTPDSICKKLIKKGLNPTLETAHQELADLFGVRIVVMYLDDIYRIAGLLKKSAGITLLYEKDYIRNPKLSGYRGLHLIFAVEILHNGELRTEKCEVQIRTMSMDSWAALEHQLIYKGKCHDKKIGEDLRKWSDEMAKQDKRLFELRKRINEEEK